VDFTSSYGTEEIKVAGLIFDRYVLLSLYHTQTTGENTVPWSCVLVGEPPAVLGGMEVGPVIGRPDFAPRCLLSLYSYEYLHESRYFTRWGRWDNPRASHQSLMSTSHVLVG